MLGDGGVTVAVLAAATVVVGHYSCRLGQYSAASARAPCAVPVRGLRLIVCAVVVRPRLRMALSVPVTPRGNLAPATWQHRRTSIRSPRSIPLTTPILNQTCRLIQACPNPTRRRSQIHPSRSRIHLRRIHRLRVVLDLGGLEANVLGGLEANVPSSAVGHPIQRMMTFRNT